ncbi:MAG: PilZ domain-containing protein [Polyangiales bacterium]
MSWSPTFVRARSSRRILRRGVCSFRPAGTSTATLGGLHDVSADGVYVRTMVPLPDGLDVWLELRPDDDSPWIHLRGVVVWRRRVGDGGLTCPRGFALRLSRTECPARDLEAWDEAYRRLVHAEVPDRLRLV